MTIMKKYFDYACSCEENNRLRIIREDIPEMCLNKVPDTISDMIKCLEEGEKPGHFVWKAMTNAPYIDLLGSADDNNAENLRYIADFVYNCMPAFDHRYLFEYLDHMNNRCNICHANRNSNKEK